MGAPETPEPAQPRSRPSPALMPGADHELGDMLPTASTSRDTGANTEAGTPAPDPAPAGLGNSDSHHWMPLGGTLTIIGALQNEVLRGLCPAILGAGHSNAACEEEESRAGAVETLWLPGALRGSDTSRKGRGRSGSGLLAPQPTEQPGRERAATSSSSNPPARQGEKPLLAEVCTLSRTCLPLLSRGVAQQQLPPRPPSRLQL